MYDDAPTTGFHRRSLSSWLLSVCVHLGLLIILGLAVRGPLPRSLPVRDRAVGITLIQGSEDAPHYFRQASAARGSRVPPTADDRLDDPRGDAFPSEAALADLSLLDLPLPGASMPAPAVGLLPNLEVTPIHRGGVPSADDVRAAREEDAAMQRQRGTRGPTTGISLFGGAPAVGNSFIFVVDRSDSMGRGGLGVLARAKREFRTALVGLEAVHRFQIIAYNHQNVFFGDSRELVSATEANKQLIDRFMSGLAAYGATNHFSAISAALYRRPDVIFLLTDGGEPSLSHPQMVQILKLARGRTAIHCIEFGQRASDGEENFMRRLARETGGSYRYRNVSQMPQ